MDGLNWKTLFKWMIWGYHYFWKHPYTFFIVKLISERRLLLFFGGGQSREFIRMETGMPGKAGNSW